MKQELLVATRIKGTEVWGGGGGGGWGGRSLGGHGHG